MSINCAGHHECDCPSPVAAEGATWTCPDCNRTWTATTARHFPTARLKPPHLTADTPTWRSDVTNDRGDS